MRKAPLRTSIAVLALAGSGFLAAPSSAAPPTTPEYDEYVALGDSYTAGPLIPTVQFAGGCIRSTNNYPSLLADRLDVETFRDVSCSGANSTHLTSPQQTAFGPVPPQFDALDADTDLVTVSIGGNDFSVFGTLVGFCPTLRAQDPTGSPCRDYFGTGGRDQLRDLIDVTTDRLVEVVHGITERSPDARVLVIGYPQIAPHRGTCPSKLPLADGDYRYAIQIERDLNAALRFAAHRGGAEYVDTTRISRGHDICSDDPWVNGQHTDPGQAQSFHPFLAGMVGVADAVEAQLTR